MKSSKPQNNDSDVLIQLKGPSRSITQSSDSGPQRGYQQPPQQSTQQSAPILTSPPEAPLAAANASHTAPPSDTAHQAPQSPPKPTSPLAQQTIPLNTVSKEKLSTSSSSQIATSGKEKRQADSKDVMPKSKRKKASKDSVKKALCVLPGEAELHTVKKGSSNRITKIQDINAMSKQINIIVKVLNRFVGRMNAKSGRRLELELSDDSGRIGAVFFDSDNDVAKMNQLDKLLGACEIESVSLKSSSTTNIHS